MKANARGPVESLPTAQTLPARVVSPGPSPRVHGYDVQSDLSVNYSVADVAFLALTGELPGDHVGRALDVVALFVGPLCVSVAPTHAATLTQLCGAPPRAVVSMAALGLSERAQAIVSEHANFLSWLDAPSGPPPAIALANDTGEAATTRLCAALRATADQIPALRHPLTLSAGAIATLHWCGLRTVGALVAFFAWASMPFVCAEALTMKAGNFRDYPLLLPDFTYVAPESP